MDAGTSGDSTLDQGAAEVEGTPAADVPIPEATPGAGGVAEQTPAEAAVAEIEASEASGGTEPNSSLVAATAPESQAAQPGGGADAAVQALIDAYKDLPGVVPDMITGSTVDEVRASLEASRKVYQNTRSQVLAELGADVPPANGGSGAAPEPKTPLEKIQAGIDASKRK